MSSFSIAVLPGDGIGPEVIDAVIPLAEQARVELDDLNEGNKSRLAVAKEVVAALPSV